MPSDILVPLRPARPCPICGNPSSRQFHPFCSGRCADIDLNRWLSGAYVIPGPQLAPEDDGSEGPVPPGFHEPE